MKLASLHLFALIAVQAQTAVPGDALSGIGLSNKVSFVMMGGIVYRK